MIRFFKIPKTVRFLYPKYIWKLPNTAKKVYLTFDDGPIPEITEWVLDILKQENIKATFFCIGDNIQKHPEVYERIVSEGHQVGNHTFHHLNGWKTSTEYYIDNFKLCETEHLKRNTEHSLLFRPPYGKIKISQANRIIKLGYKIIMWDILSYDFDTKVNPEKCLSKIINNTTEGSIIVFHDSIKASSNLKLVLPKAIQALKEKGFLFDKIN